MSEVRPIAGGDVGMLANIVATGRGTESNIHAVGSTIAAALEQALKYQNEKIKSFALAISMISIVGCAQDVPQKTLLMKNESDAFKDLCLEGRVPITHAFKGSMSTIFIYCEPAKDSSFWTSEVKMVALFSSY